LGFTVKNNQLEIHLFCWADKVPAEDIKGYYLGTFSEALLVHFKDDFDTFTVHK